jgi:hypothetical protein
MSSIISIIKSFIRKQQKFFELKSIDIIGFTQPYSLQKGSVFSSQKQKEPTKKVRMAVI